MAEEKDLPAAYLESVRSTMERLITALDRRNALIAPSTTTTTQTTTIDAGSKALWFGLWLSTTCCIVMFILGLEQRDKLSNMQVQLADTSRKLDVAQDKLSIVLQWAPNLRDEVNKEMKSKEKAN